MEMSMLAEMMCRTAVTPAKRAQLANRTLKIGTIINHKGKCSRIGRTSVSHIGKTLRDHDRNHDNIHASAATEPTVVNAPIIAELAARGSVDCPNTRAMRLRNAWPPPLKTSSSNHRSHPPSTVAGCTNNK